MKLGLKKKERTEQLNFRVEAILKQDLIGLFKECDAKGIDSTAALNVGLRQIAQALRRELDEVSDVKTDGKADATTGAKKRPLPASQPILPNGSIPDRT
jgi:hypothetical protein